MLHQTRDTEAAVSSMLEYTIITAFLMVLFLTVTAVSNGVFLTGPLEILRSQEYLDVVDSVSVQIVDLAVLVPQKGTIGSRLDLANPVGDTLYSVQIVPDIDRNSVGIEAGDGDVTTNIDLCGFGTDFSSGEMVSVSGNEYVLVKFGGEQ